MEMLASAMVMGLVGAGIAGLVMLNGITERKMSNKVDDLNAARTAIERVARDVRMARNLGDVFGKMVLLQAKDPPSIPDDIYGFSGSASFPSSNDPIYPSTQPPGGWPPAPWPVAPNPGYALSNQCLIVQSPVFDSQGFPVAKQMPNGLPPNDDVDTLVYMVVKDPDSPDSKPTFMLQLAAFPGTGSTLALPANPPTTLLKGIVGPTANAAPVGLDNPPVCFQFLDKETGNPRDTGTDENGNFYGNLTGVIVQFQVQNNSASANEPAIVGVKSEVYARNNNVQTVTATTDQLNGWH